MKRPSKRATRPATRPAGKRVGKKQAKAKKVARKRAARTPRHEGEPAPEKKPREVRKRVEFFNNLQHTHARIQRAFLIAYAMTGNITKSARAAGIDRVTHKNWLEHEGPAGEAYRAAFEDAKEMAADLLEGEAWRRAVRVLVRYKFTKDGDPIIHPKTGQPYFELEYSDTVLLALLRANRSEKFRDRIEHSGPKGGPIETKAVDELTDDERRRRLAALLASEKGQTQ